MRISQEIACQAFPCPGVDHDKYIVPDTEVHPQNISIAMISEAAPPYKADYYYAKGSPMFEQTTVQAFQDAGVNLSCIQDLLDMGVYLTTAVKCGKMGYGIKAGVIKECSLILEKEIEMFPNIKVFMLMGDVAIKALNYIAKKSGEDRVIPAGSTYKIRGRKYFYKGRRAFPSYLQAGPSFFIEKSKRRMIAEDIKAALTLIQ
jgi:hypothetical protein